MTDLQQKLYNFYACIISSTITTNNILYNFTLLLKV